MNRTQLENRYFEWLYESIWNSKYAPHQSMRRLFEQLHAMEFSYTNSMDYNRAMDGVELRYNFDPELSKIDTSSCSVLEMLIALAEKCEGIAGDPDKGDQTMYWFWMMIENMGLMSVTDHNYDSLYVEGCAARMMNRTYNPDGSNGGLFHIPTTAYDLRKVEIWYQMCWYLDSIL